MKLPKNIRPILFFALVLAKTAQAIEGPSFDCDLAVTKIEKNICEAYKTEAVDVRALDRIVAKIYSNIHRSDAGIVTSQREWIKTRNECDLSDEAQTQILNRLQQQILLNCLLESYNKRTSALLSIGQPTEVITSDGVCEALAANGCPGKVVQQIDTGRETMFFFSDQRNSYLIVKGSDGGVDWEASWVGQALRSVNTSKPPVWGAATDLIPEHLITPGKYRGGCPDCGTQDRIFVRVEGNWEPIDLVRFNHRLRLFTAFAEETYMHIDEISGNFTVKVAFSDFRQAQVEDLSYLTANGVLKGNIFVPQAFEVSIR